MMPSHAASDLGTYDMSIYKCWGGIQNVDYRGILRLHIFKLGYNPLIFYFIEFIKKTTQFVKVLDSKMVLVKSY